MAAVGIALGRDPLQVEGTPYEVLDLERGASGGDIEDAFRSGLRSRASVPKLTAARIALERPLERGVIDLFLYDPAVLEWLSPSPLRDPGALEPARRALTAQAWEELLRRRFPDIRLAHCLAVFWYWWAARSGQSAEGELRPEQRWRRAIGYWAMLAANDEFWERDAGATADPSSLLRDAVVDRLVADLRKLPAVAQDGEGEHEDLELTLRQEYGAARELYAAGLHTEHGRVSCGPLLLRHFGMLDGVRAQVAARLQRSPTDRRMLRLREMLSEHAPIRALLGVGKPAEALAAIDALPDGHAGSPEVAALRAHALLELGRERASLDRLDDALDCWSQALAVASGEEVEQGLRAQIVTACRTRAAALARRPEQAMLILEKGLALVRDDSLALALAELLHHRGADMALAAKERIHASGQTTKESLDVLARALADLDRAADFGSEAAAEDGEIVHELIREATDSPGTVQDLREAIRSSEAEAASVLRARLATLLCNRAVATARRAAEDAEGARARENQAYELALLQMRAGRRGRADRGVRCDLCAAGGGGQFFPFELAGEPSFLLCHGCARRMRGLGSAPTADRALALLDAAESDLTEALGLDERDVIRDNLQDVRALREKLVQEASRTLERARMAGQRTARRPYNVGLHASYLLGSLLVLLLSLFFAQRC